MLSSSQRSIESAVPAVTFTHFYHLVFTLFFNSFPRGWDELCHEIYLVRLTQYVLFSEFSKGCFCLTLSCSSLRREVAFFLSHCCRQTDLLRSHILWSIMWVSLEVCLGPVKSSIDATVIRVLRF